MSVFFPNARDVITAGGNFHHVEGDQNTYNGPTTIIQERIKTRTELDEFYRVRRGAVCRQKNIYINKYPRRWDAGHREWWDSKDGLRVDRTVCAARVLDQPGMMFTVMEYEGPEARKAFEEDFRTFSRASTSDVWQVYGYNDSNVPLLISYNELVPVAHLEGSIGKWGEMYLSNLHHQLGCDEKELWIDTGRGLICRGPRGPYSGLISWNFDIQDLPLTAKLLQEDALMRFPAGLKSKRADLVVLVGVSRRGPWSFDVHEPGVSQPTVISTLTNTPIAVANNAWRSKWRLFPWQKSLEGRESLEERELLEHGLTRFTLNGGLALSGGHFWLEWNWDAQQAWLSQAWSVLHSCEISLEDDLSVYKLVYPQAELYVDISNSEVQHRRRSQQPIYLFVRPPLLGLPHDKTSSLHYWSFDEGGQSAIPCDVCDDLGLPVQLLFHMNLSLYSWSNDDYKSIHQHQHLRGFDPTTIDFAHIGFDDNIYQPLGNSDQFKQAQQEPSPEDESFALVPTNFGRKGTVPSDRLYRVFNLIPPGSVTRPSESTSFWSTILPPLSSTVFKDSDILTVGF
ncbi:hypothetical protein PQX77_012434 [Marasmius sp. AFHP31]|nr:hypothetical protein PQX77_012434 [Marasmius sp. AFHP31]